MVIPAPALESGEGFTSTVNFVPSANFTGYLWVYSRINGDISALHRIDSLVVSVLFMLCIV